jgi:hypothetical protein
VTSEQTQMLPKTPKYGEAKIVGLISDTHIPVRARSLPKEVFKIFEKGFLALIERGVKLVESQGGQCAFGPFFLNDGSE